MSNTATAAAPLYQQVYDAVFAQIVSGELGPGVMLPSEMDLAAFHKVSQGTARKALMELEQSGVVERKQGRGTFVAATTPETALYHFFRLRRKDGTQAIPEERPANVVVRNATRAEASALMLTGKKVIDIRRTRSVDSEVACHEICILDANTFAGLKDRDPLTSALYPIYQRLYGVHINRADEKIKAIAAKGEIAAALEIEEDTPILMVERIALGIDGKPVEFRLSYFKSDKFHYSVALK